MHKQAVSIVCIWWTIFELVLHLTAGDPCAGDHSGPKPP